MTTYDQFYRAVLTEMGVKLPPYKDGLAARRTLAAVSIWEGANTYWNPLNDTVPFPGSRRVNSAGVQAYPSRPVGVRATAALLLQSNTWAIRAAISCSPYRRLILAQFADFYGSWSSKAGANAAWFTKFDSITPSRADAWLAAPMTGPGAP